MTKLRFEPLDPFRSADVYTDCYAKSWLAAHGSLFGFSPTPYLEDVKCHFRRDENSLIAAYTGDTLAGILELDTAKGRHTGYGWVSLVYLAPEYRGQGHGKELLGKAAEVYAAMGRHSLRLHVSSMNKNAIGFYEHLGFKLLSESPGCGAPLYLMERKI